MNAIPVAAEIFTDGACLNNPGPGGYAALIRIDGQERTVVGKEPHTTNNRMELTAVIAALRDLPSDIAATVFSDSQYVIKGMTTWLAGWKAKGWRKADRKPVENVDLWKTLDDLARDRVIQWEWVRGHNGHPENERVDQLANEQAGIV